jgi:hypothetical protein
MLTCLFAYTSSHQYTQEEAGGCGYVHARLRALSVPLCAQSYIFDIRKLTRACGGAFCVHIAARASLRVSCMYDFAQSETDEARSRVCIDPIFLWSVSVYACMRVVK